MITATIPQKTNLKYVPETYESTTLDHINIFPKQRSEYERIFYILSGQKYLQILLEKMEDGKWIATSTQIDTYGTGDTQQEALDNFRKELILYFSELRDDEENLGPHLQQELQVLNRLFGRGNAFQNS